MLKRHMLFIRSIAHVTSISRQAPRSMLFIFAATFAGTFPAIAATAHLVADKDRTNVDVFDSPSTACRYWTVYRSAGGITLIGIGPSVDYNAVKMRGLSFAGPRTQVTTAGTATLRCPKVRSIGVEIDPKKTLSLVKVRLAGSLGVDRFVLHENVR